ncbi:MAG: hypothetical protein ACK4ND_11240 [Cytophagaceae bacterium]
MNPKYSHTEQIDKYLAGELNPEERIALEKKIDNDSDFALEVEAQRIANEMILGQELLMLKDQMKTDLKPKTGFNFYYLAIFLMIASLAGALYLSSGTVKHEAEEPAKEQKPLPAKEKSEAVPDEPLKKEVNSGITTIANNTKKENKITKDNPERKVFILPDTTQNIEQISTSEPKDTLKKQNLTVDPLSQNTPDKPSDIHQVEKEAIIDCSGITITAEVKAGPTCPDDQKGRIEIVKESIKGSKGPYLFRLNDSGNFTKETEFFYLNQGTYTLYIKDGNDCIKILAKAVEVETKECGRNLNFTFSPTTEYAWPIPVPEGKSATIKIVSKTGMVVYQALADNAAEWTGLDLNGNEVSSGYYIFVLEYPDGKVEQGSITILR